MKKLLIILLLLFAINATAQIDTANWSIIRNSVDGKYSLLTNRTEIGGVAAGGIIIPIIFTANQIDTSLFQLLPNQSNGKYSIATNRGVLYGIDTNDIRISVMYDMGGVNLNSANTWTGAQRYDTLYAKRFNYGLDTTGYIATNGKIYVPDGSATRPSYSFKNSLNTGLYWDGSKLILLVNGTVNGYFGTSYYQGRDLVGFSNKANDLGYNNILWRNAYLASINLAIDSTGAIDDSVYITRHTLLVNCSATDSNVVWLSDYNAVAGQRYMVKKIDANAINVIVKSKSGYTIDGAVSKIWNTQYESYTFVYRNKTWYIL